MRKMAVQHSLLPAYAVESSPGNADQKIDISDSEFTELARLIKSISGIVLTDRKRHLMTSRLRQRLMLLNLPDYRAYIEILKSPAGKSETKDLISAISTNLTGFFREPHHFRDMIDCLKDAGDFAPKSKRLRIWSSACSTGEEPYSVAMALTRSNVLRSFPDTRILATDIDATVLRTAETGIYTAKQIAKCGHATQRNCFTRLSGDRFEVDPEIKPLVIFNQLNLQGHWPIKRSFDFIFCRNVLIYFDDSAKKKTVARLVDMLNPGGTLYLGHSESLLGNSPGLNGFGNCIFRKTT